MKKSLSAEMQKKLNDIVIELDGIENKVPYNFKSVFNFPGRKSPEIAQKIIAALTEENAIIYDPFLGSGSFVIASVNANRKIIANEIDNYSFHIVKTLFSTINFVKLDEYFELIKDQIGSIVLDLYATKCCGSSNYIKQ